MQTYTHKQAKRFKKLAAAGAITLTLTGSVMQASTLTFADDDVADTTTKASGGDEKGLKVTPDATNLNKAVKDAQAAGVDVTVADTKTTTVGAKYAAANKKRVDGTYADKVKELKDLATQQKAADAQYAKDEASYKTALAAYNKAVEGQTNDAEPSNPLQPEQLAYEQPFDLIANKNGLSKVSVTSTKISDKSQITAGDLYNSDYIRRIKVSDTTKPITITYKNVAKDKESGKSLDVTLTLSDFVTDKIDTQGSSADANPYIYVYSNYADSVSQFNVVAMKQSTTYTYSNSGKSYDKDYYQTYGSLNYQDNNRYEFTAPDSGVKATFLNKGTAIANKLQKVSGKASSKASEAFMGVAGTTQPEDAWDTRPEALTELGVTYLVNNGAFVWLGVSGGDGKEPVAKPGDGGYWATYNHIMMGANTVAPTVTKPVEPKKPAPLKAEVQLENLLVTPEVTKDVDAGTNKGNAKGSADGQTFMVGDKMTYSMKASDLPAGRDEYKSLAYTDQLPEGFTFDKASAIDANGNDVSNQLKLTEKDGVFTATFKPGYVAQINKDKAKSTPLPTIIVSGTANKDHVTLKNVFDFVVDGDSYESNEVTNEVSDVTAHKTVEAGVKDTATGNSIDGKSVAKGQILTYELTTDDLPANRATDVKSFVWRDKLPKYVDLKSYKIMDANGEDVTDSYEDKGDGKRNLNLVRKSTTDMNEDKTKVFKNDTVFITVVANEDGVNFKNQATNIINGGDRETNEVTNQTPSYHPEKQDVNDKGEDINGKHVKPGDTIHYKVVGDLSDMTNMAITPDMLKQELFSISDDYDENKLSVTPEIQQNLSVQLEKSVTSDLKDSEDQSNKDDDDTSVTTDTPQTENDTTSEVSQSETDESQSDTSDTEVQPTDGTIFIGKGTADEFDMNDVTVDWDIKNGRWKLTPKDDVEFLQKYAGNKLIITFSPQVKKGATGVVRNTAIQTTFGNEQETNTVKNPITDETVVTTTEKDRQEITHEKNVHNKTTVDTTSKESSSVKKATTKELAAETAPEKQLPTTGSNGPLQRIVNWFMGLVK